MIDFDEEGKPRNRSGKILEQIARFKRQGFWVKEELSEMFLHTSMWLVGVRSLMDEDL